MGHLEALLRQRSEIRLGERFDQKELPLRVSAADANATAPAIAVTIDAPTTTMPRDDAQRRPRSLAVFLMDLPPFARRVSDGACRGPAARASVDGALESVPAVRE